MLSAEELKMIGGSDLGAIVGVDSYRTPLDVYLRIVEGVEQPDNKLFRRGNLMESVIRTMAAEDFNLTLLGPRKLKDSKRPYIRANLDDVNKGNDGEEVVEFKSVSFHAANKYGDGDDEVPESHILQCQLYMHENKSPRARLYALIGLDDLRQYVLTADVEIQSMVLEAVDRFWVDHVLKKVPPPVDGSKACAEWLAKRYPKNNGDFVKAGPEGEKWARVLRAARHAKEEAERQEQEAKNHLISAIADADGIEGEDFRITFKLVKGRAKTDFEAVCKEAHVPDELIRRHTAIGSGYRRFVPKFHGESTNE